MPTGADVPSIYDVVIDSQGYLYDDTQDARAEYTYSPTFLERTNVTGSYGDNQQDFFLTAAQNDWSGGDGQRFFHPSDADSKNRVFLASNVDVTIPGQIKLMPATVSVAMGANVLNATNDLSFMYTASATNLYKVSSSGAVTNIGAHGLAGSPTAIVFDGVNVVFGDVNAVRRWSGAFAAFSATGILATGLCFVSNTLFGYSTNGFGYYDTVGTWNTVLARKSMTGAVFTDGPQRMIPYGGKVALLFSSANAPGSELWVGDTTGMSRVADFPNNFNAWDMCEHMGIIYTIGVEFSSISSRTAIYYYANGTVGRLWASEWASGLFGEVGITPWGTGLLFTDGFSATLKIYELTTGATYSVGSWTSNLAPNNRQAVGSSLVHGLVVNGTATAIMFFSAGTYATSGSVSSSLIDFDNSLTKLFRSVKVDWIPATDGNGGTVDISYQIDNLDGAYTTLQTGAVSGTEYTFPANTTGRAISVKVTINKGTSTKGPTLKRVYVRGAPSATSFKRRKYYLKLGGRTGGSLINPLIRRDGTSHTRDAKTMATDLQTSLAQSSVSITDHIGTFTGVIEGDGLKIIEKTPEYWIALVEVREV
jgi:hypothetical protein